jgi:hypothetical protein
MSREATRERTGSRIGFFGTFFPESEFAGNSSTGIVAALIRNAGVESLVIFSQVGSYLPDTVRYQKVELRPCWSHDNPISLLFALRDMLRHSSNVDGFLFNVFLTAFGRTSFANGVGLLVPSLVALLSRKPVVVYMHNFLETQDVAQLGYRPTILQRLGVRFLEGLLLKHTIVAVPLRSQQEKVMDVFQTAPRTIPLPFIEPFGLMAISAESHKRGTMLGGEPTRILLLGTWGPQKDLSGVLSALRVAHERGGRFVVDITGAINPQFPGYQKEVDQAAESMDPEWFHFLERIPEDRILDAVLDHDLLILPYNASGGYSGAMSLGAYCGMGIIAYDLPQLREAADALGLHPSFVKKGNLEAIVNAILSFCAGVRTFRESRLAVPRPEYDSLAYEWTERLVEMFESPERT